ncbi:AGR380Cp [Eremothecium gossypii ATCC 10895]|uniref:Mediator of RNA polymerase II transcription subunit 5 n=1 Tax=Eremothecium gossypii (strain ATCC 10895 / CBS 109.51 / FGSC 9923 / NRRL Y-1056) TaxID=284811 RepID=MED5_EREGS|nr:AGR380Cp [Eremothecium gossypii ATCC 10895]Q74Z26.1 RecName: Full=Mediator of RNA polymerase II transcription subunit 5; AltName: Full=Mediator complex subunit 5 [Eremothecium gossypii ATCC 10895]AAS54870.1 AGR380Cp [Eremothecium gossypii ATCC 10895]AEY99202.1 FAGR380Cp [Eremothecium gossypii FDAG1]
MVRAQETVYDLITKCSVRRVPPKQFVNFYNEFFNERYDSVLENGNPAGESRPTAPVYEEVAQDLVRILNDSRVNLVADYVLEIVLINLNVDLLRLFLPKLHHVRNVMLLVHLFSRATAFISGLDNKLLAEQISDTVYTDVTPAVLSFNMQAIDDQLVIVLAKFLHAVLRLPEGQQKMGSVPTKQKAATLLQRLSTIDRLLYKRFIADLDGKLRLSGAPADMSFPLPPSNMPSPSVTSPKYETSSVGVMKRSTSMSNEAKYQDIKLARYYKNLWLNNKIHYCTVSDPLFLEKYDSILELATGGGLSADRPVKAKIADLVETAFTCFAQFVSNKLYHQSNSNFSLLERKWTVFVTKQLPLIIKSSIPDKTDIVLRTLENIDDKVIKAIKSYNTEKEEVKNRTEDLFDDYPVNSLDIRHEFLKNLIMMGLQPPTVLNEYLREDQMVDLKSLVTSEHLIIDNSQGVRETILNVRNFITKSIESLEFENLFDDGNQLLVTNDHGIIQIAHNLETISPTKQLEIANILYDLLSAAIESLDHKTISKVLTILTLNVGHLLTNIFCLTGYEKFARAVIRFIDVIWESNKSKSNDMVSDDSEFENINSAMAYTLSLCFIIHVVDIYGVNVEALVENPSKSTVLRFLSKLGEIPEVFVAPEGDLESSKTLLQQWLRELFVKNLISDNLMKSADVKVMGFMIPFIFKQTLLNVEYGIISDISSFVNGFEYFLQPFLSVGLINIVFWLEKYLLALKTTESFPKINGALFDILGAIIAPKSIGSDAKAIHSVVLKLKCVGLLKELKSFQVPSESNYGIYSSQTRQDPRLEALISKLELIAQSSALYDVDPRIISAVNNNYSQKHISYNKVVLTSDIPINKIMTNQINSFWNLHSSTYYNFDYLLELIDLVTPFKFVQDVFQTLKYKVTAYGVPGSATKPSSAALDQVLGYVFYFMVLRDIKCPEEKSLLLEYLDSGRFPSSISATVLTSDPTTISGMPPVSMPYDVKSEQDAMEGVDEDFDMLFGESFSGLPDDVQKSADMKPDTGIKEDDSEKSSYVSAARLTESFGVIFSKMKKDKLEAYQAGQISEERYQCFMGLYDKYVQTLRHSVI